MGVVSSCKRVIFLTCATLNQSLCWRCGYRLRIETSLIVAHGLVTFNATFNKLFGMKILMNIIMLFIDIRHNIIPKKV